MHRWLQQEPWTIAAESTSSPADVDALVALAAMDVRTLWKGGVCSLARALACLSKARTERCSTERIPCKTFTLRAAASRYIPGGLGR